MLQNIQSFQAHRLDLESDQFFGKCDIIALTKTKSRAMTSLQDYDCISYSCNKNDAIGGTTIFIKSTCLTEKFSVGPGNNTCYALNGINMCSVTINTKCSEIHLFVIYVHVNTKPSTVKSELRKVLSKFTVGNCDDTPLVLCGDSNINAKAIENKPLVDFIESKWGVTLVSDPAVATTKSNTCIDMIFCRGLNLQLQHFTSYYSHHNPIFFPFTTS